MYARGTKIKASVDGLKVLIQKKLDEDTEAHEKASVEYDKKLTKWAEDAQKKIAAMTVDEIKEASDKYGAFAFQLPARPQPPREVDKNHQRLLNMLELTSDDSITLSLDSEFYSYLS